MCNRPTFKIQTMYIEKRCTKDKKPCIKAKKYFSILLLRAQPQSI